MKIAIASGKGGTGKTTVSVNLSYFIGKYLGKKATLVDCDVEEPNDALFFENRIIKTEKTVFQLIPEIDTNSCTFCKKCSDWCEFNAITIIRNRGFAEVNSDLCHSCGACSVACNFGAITEKKQALGVITHFETGIGNGLTEGRLEIGSAMQTSLIKEVKKTFQQNGDLILLDAPPGTSCPVVETVFDADYVLLISEPTPFGLYDLKIIVEMLTDLKKPFGIIINKAGLGSNEIYEYIAENRLELLAKIPFSRAYAAQYAAGSILQEIPPEMEQVYRDLIGKLTLKLALA